MNAAAGAVLTGGNSRRMGTDKALVEVDGVPMARRVASALVGAGCRPVWCQGGSPERLAGLGLDVVGDSEPGGGPLAAIGAALVAVARSDEPRTGVVVAACDLPALTAEAVVGLLEVAPGDRPAALAVEGRPQLVSWWPLTCAPALSDLLAGGIRSHHAALDRLGGLLVEIPGHVLRNVNVPGDLSG